MITTGQWSVPMKELWSRMKQALLGDVETHGIDPDFDEEDALRPSQLTSLGKLVELLASKLGAERAAAFAQQAMQVADRNMGEAMAFASATNLDVELPLSLYLDWNGSDEVERKINRVLQTLEVNERWHWKPDLTGQSMQATFKSLEDWLRPRGYHMWHVNTDGDDALLFPIELKDAELAARLADEFGMQLFTLAESAPYYGVVTE